MPKGGARQGAGRKKILPDITTRNIREKIKSEKVVEFLHKVVEGKIKDATVGEQIYASKILLDKSVPNLQAMQISGDEDKPIGVIVLPARNEN